MAADARERPTRLQVELLRTYIASGSIAGAAHELGITGTTARQHLSRMYQRTGCPNIGQAAYQLGRAESVDTQHSSRTAPGLRVVAPARKHRPPNPDRNDGR
jgi:hypothetical protein